MDQVGSGASFTDHDFNMRLFSSPSDPTRGVREAEGGAMFPRASPDPTTAPRPSTLSRAQSRAVIFASAARALPLLHSHAHVRTWGAWGRGGGARGSCAADCRAPSPRAPAPRPFLPLPRAGRHTEPQRPARPRSPRASSASAQVSRSPSARGAWGRCGGAMGCCAAA